jgi:hypothetical protein
MQLQVKTSYYILKLIELISLSRLSNKVIEIQLMRMFVLFN